MDEKKQRMIQEYVPGRQLTLAHIIASPQKELAKKIGNVDAIVTAEAKGIALAYEVSRQLGLKEFIVARKMMRNLSLIVISKIYKKICPVICGYVLWLDMLFTTRFLMFSIAMLKLGCGILV